MKTIFSDTNNKLKFKNITPSPGELAVLQLPSECFQFEVDEQYSSSSDDDLDYPSPSKRESDDDFQDPPPPSCNEKRKGKSVASYSPLKKRKKQQPSDGAGPSAHNIDHVPAIGKHVKKSQAAKIVIRRPSVDTRKAASHRPIPNKQPRTSESEDQSIRKELHSFRKEVRKEFEDIRKMINNNFKIVLEVMNSNQSSKKDTHFDDPLVSKKTNEDHSKGSPPNTRQDFQNVQDNVDTNQFRFKENIGVEHPEDIMMGMGVIKNDGKIVNDPSVGIERPVVNMMNMDDILSDDKIGNYSSVGINSPVRSLIDVDAIPRVAKYGERQPTQPIFVFDTPTKEDTTFTVETHEVSSKVQNKENIIVVESPVPLQSLIELDDEFLPSLNNIKSKKDQPIITDAINITNEDPGISTADQTPISKRNKRPGAYNTSPYLMSVETHEVSSKVQNRENIIVVESPAPIQSQIELNDEFLSSLNNIKSKEDQPIITDAINITKEVPAISTADQTPPQKRNKRPGPYNTSPYLTSFGSSAGSSSIQPVIFKLKHPFTFDLISGTHDTILLDAYRTWVREGLLVRHENKLSNQDHYKKKHAEIPDKLQFGIDLIYDKNWFYKLSFKEQMLNDSHINVILYYLRKKAKYNAVSTYRYTTVDCVFMTKISTIWNNYADLESGKSSVDEERAISAYIEGYKLHAAIPWHTVDHVFIPIHVDEKLHWVLAVVSLNDKHIDVYDSYRSAGHNAFVKFEIEKLSQLIPLYLTMTDFYGKKGIDTSSSQEDDCFFDVVFKENIPQQVHGSLDCGVFMLAYAEYLSYGQGIPDRTFDAEFLRSRFAYLLWNYGQQKNEAGATSDSEAPPRIKRPQFDCGSSERIELH